ncbi:MAG: hypothetical protein EOP10_25205 [Proteobacteria bacterium]|nr:MAG: hypothetical protein EOP10_25205 [Pseudomonadota bacterium]
MFYRFLSIALCLLLSHSSYAQSVAERGRMIDSLVEYRKSANSIYQPPPITHMVPSFNTITYAIAFEKRNIEILPRFENGDLDETTQSSLKLTGYTIAPHLAISLKKVGIGLSIENSKNQSFYSHHNPYNNYDYEQTSTVSTAGLGFNVSVLPFDKLRKEHKLAFIAGGKSLNVKHQFTDLLNTNDTSRDTLNARYNILKYELGANLTLQLLKNFRVIPWVDYTMTDVKNAEAAFDEKSGAYVSSGLYKDDLRLYWQSSPNIRYGIDLSVGVFGLDIRIGSIFGKLARLGSDPDYYKDSSFNISLSFDQAGG